MIKLPKTKAIAAIIPHFSASENCTIIITNSGEKICCTYRLQTILKHIAYEQCIDLAAVKKHASQVTAKNILQPLPLSPASLLVPLKVRIPYQKGQPSIGYVNLYSIKNIADNGNIKLNPPYRSAIELSGGYTLPVIWTSATIKKQLRCARFSACEIPGLPAARISLQQNELRPLAQKLIELIYDILLLKEK